MKSAEIIPPLQGRVDRAERGTGGGVWAKPGARRLGAIPPPWPALPACPSPKEEG